MPLEWFEEDHEWDQSPEKQAEWADVVLAFTGVQQKPGRDWLRAACPACVEAEGKEDHKESLGYNPWTGKYRCFKCGMSGFLPISRRTEISDDPDTLIERALRPVEPVVVQPASGYTPLFEEPGLSSQSLAWARRYVLETRSGLTLEACRAVGVGAASWGQLSQRVLVPFPDYVDPNGKWRGWVGRAVGPSNRPYLYSKGFERRDYLYNAPALLVETNDPVYIVEGAFDAIALWPDGVAVLGKPLVSHQELFRRSKRPIAVALDGDIPDIAQALAWTLRHHGKMAVFLRLPPKTDPDELGKAELRRLYDRALEQGE